MHREDVMSKKIRVNWHQLTCYLDGELFLLYQERVLDRARHITVGTLSENHGCFQIEQALGILDYGFHLWRQALPFMIFPLSLGLGVPATGTALQLNASFLEALKGNVRV